MATLVPEHSFQHKVITVGVMLATIMQALDSTIANVALPHMQGSLAATQDQISWVLTSYIVAAAITIPLVGWLAGIIGRKFIFLISIIGFTITSVLCGMAESLPQMVLFRLLQGMSGAAFLPLSQAVLFDINSKKNFGKAMAIWGIGVMLGPILGPTLGGWLTENYDWRWVFFINVPFGILAFMCLYFFLPESSKAKKYFDGIGFVTLALSIAFLQLFLDRGNIKDWFGANEIVIYAIGCCLAFYLYIVHTMTCKKPFLEPGLFLDRNFVVSNILMFVIGIVLYATLALTPSMIQTLLEYPVDTTGILVAPRGFGAMLGMIIVGKLITRIDPRWLTFTGLSLTAFSLYQMTNYTIMMDWKSIVYPGIIQGIGLGMAYVSLTTFGFSTLDSKLRTEGTAFFNLVRNIGSSIGISVVETVLVRYTQIVHSSLATHIVPYNLSAYLGEASRVIDPYTPQGLSLLNALTTQQAAMIAYIDDFYLMMIITVAVTPLIFLMKAPDRSKMSDEPVVME